MTKRNKKLILLVEDERILFDTLKEKLISEGFDVIGAVNGDEGFNIAIHDHPDLILLDLLMPKVDGLTMLKKLFEDPWGAHAAIIILTNMTDMNLRNEGMIIGLKDVYNTCDYMIKTEWSLNEVITRIKKKLNVV